MRLRYGPGDWRWSEHERFGRARYIIKTYVFGRGYTGSRMPRLARLRATWHAGILCYDGEICRSCGRPVLQSAGSYWLALDTLWALVYGEYATGVYCIPCFTRDAEKAGIYVYWTPKVYK